MADEEIFNLIKKVTKSKKSHGSEASKSKSRSRSKKRSRSHERHRKSRSRRRRKKRSRKRSRSRRRRHHSRHRTRGHRSRRKSRRRSSDSSSRSSSSRTPKNNKRKHLAIDNVPASDRQAQNSSAWKTALAKLPPKDSNAQQGSTGSGLQSTVFGQNIDECPTHFPEISHRPALTANAHADERDMRFSAWLRSLDDGHGCLLSYMDAIRREFECDFSQVAAARLSEPISSGVLGIVDPSFFEVIGVKSMGHRLLFAKGIAALP